MDIHSRLKKPVYQIVAVLVGGGVGMALGVAVGGVVASRLGLFPFVVVGFFVGTLPALVALRRAEVSRSARDDSILKMHLQSLSEEDARAVIKACNKRAQHDPRIRLGSMVLLITGALMMASIPMVIYATSLQGEHVERLGKLMLAKHFPGDSKYVVQETLQTKCVDFFLENQGPINATVGLFTLVIFVVALLLTRCQWRIMREICPDVIKDLGVPPASGETRKIT